MNEEKEQPQNEDKKPTLNETQEQPHGEAQEQPHGEDKKQALNEAKRKIVDAAEKATKKLDELYNQLPLDKVNEKLKGLPFQADVKSPKFKIGLLTAVAVLILLIVVLCFSACGSSPKDTVRTWHEALIVMSDCMELQGLAGMFPLGASKADKEEERENLKNAVLSNEGYSSDKKYACVLMEVKDSDNLYFLLKKIDGKWKIISIGGKKPAMDKL